MKRIITSFGLMAMLFAGLFIHSLFWLVFVLIFCVGGGVEFAAIQFKGRLPALSFLVIGACFAFPANAYLRCIGLPYAEDAVIIAAIVILTPILFVLNKGEISDFKMSVPMAVYGSLWIGYLFSFLLPLYFVKLNGLHYGIQTVFVYTYMVCGNDVGAYYFGRRFGKHKLSLVYSPKKTWEGAVGGWLFTIFCAFLCKFTFASAFQIHDMIIISTIIAITGSLGDLAESVFKRSCSVKDTGDVLPGHGGILDRIDSQLLATPAFFWYLHYVMIN